MFRFNDANVYWTMYLLSDGKRIGRKRLADEVGIGEGSMRRILDTLQEWEYISIKQTGITITKSGQNFLDQTPIQPVDIHLDGSVLGSEQQGVIVKGVANKVNNGMEQRDAGIKVGAEGCTTIVYRDGKLCIPPDWDLDIQNPDVAKKIRDDYGMKEDDALIVGGGSTKTSAVIAAVSAALELF